MQTIVYGYFQFNPRQCSVMHSGVVKHSLSGLVQSCPAHCSPLKYKVPSMQVDCSVFPSGTAQLHESQLQQSSPVRCSAVQSTPGIPAHLNTVRCIPIWSAMSSTMQSCWVKGSAVPSIRVNCLSEKATFKSNLGKCSPVQSHHPNEISTNTVGERFF